MTSEEQTLGMKATQFTMDGFSGLWYDRSQPQEYYRMSYSTCVYIPMNA